MIANVVEDKTYEIIPEKGPREKEDLDQFENGLLLRSHFNLPLNTSK